MSGEASSARTVIPLRPRVASALIRSVIRGLRSSVSSTSRVARSETCLPTRLKRLITASRSSSVTSTFLPRTSILTLVLLPSGWPNDATPAVRRRQPRILGPGAGERQGDHPLAPFSPQGAGAGGKGRSGRVDVVDEQRPRRGRSNRPHPERISEPGPPPPAHLARTVGAAQAGGVGEARERRQGEGDLLGGIESAPAPPPRGRRHRDNRPPELLGRTGSKDRLGRHPRQRQPP